MTVKQVLEQRLQQPYQPQEAINGIINNYINGHLTHDDTHTLLKQVKVGTQEETIIVEEQEQTITHDIFALYVEDDALKGEALKPLRMAEIQARLHELDIKTFKFIDGDLTAEAYEPYKQEKQALREEYRILEE